MYYMNKIKSINDVLETYFRKENVSQKIPAKELMQIFIQNGIFEKDYKNGLPIRKILRDLDKKKELFLIPYAHPERKDKNTNWFFVNINKKSSTPYLQTPDSNRKEQTNNTIHKTRKDSDEYYIISLCNEILSQKAVQQYKFDFLKGDSGKPLPVDAYYEKLNLVIEYCESQHTISTPFFDKKITISGVSRGEQRKIYDERRKNILPQHGINVISIHYSDFGTTKKLIRNRDKDIEIIKRILNEYI